MKVLTVKGTPIALVQEDNGCENIVVLLAKYLLKISTNGGIGNNFNESMAQESLG